jgi:Fungal protein kinase
MRLEDDEEESHWLRILISCSAEAGLFTEQGRPLLSVGRPINEFKFVRELLEACRDFIKAHRSFYYDGKILHWDISENNITVTSAEGEENPRGMPIDLDLVKELDSGLSGARHRTGTIESMVIEILEGGANTYRCDLESFFYVFLWVIIRCG